jgi:RNA-binding protein 5/10
MWVSEKRYVPADCGNEELILTKLDVVPSSPPKSLTQKAWKYNDGSGDVGNSPSQFLLVRGLDTMMQEDTIAQGLERLEVELKRILLIRDRNTNISWGFAFVEYQDSSVNLPHSVVNNDLW